MSKCIAAIPLSSISRLSLEEALAARATAEEPTEYYTMKYSGEEIDALLNKVAAM